MKDKQTGQFLTEGHLLKKGWTPQASSVPQKVGSGGQTTPSGGSAVSNPPTTQTPAKRS